MNILLKVSGSISAYKVCSLASSLVKEGYSVKVAASKSSLNFVGAATWEGLTGNQVLSDDFFPGQRMQHIHLNDWADLVVFAPASAQSLNAISTGVGSGVVTTLFLARAKETPYLIFPAMNPRMWASESVERSVENLKSMKGVEVFSPNQGIVACGHEGAGRLKEPEEILDIVLKYDQKPKNVLVSFGGTSEDIDGVRKITNFSTGRTGLAICSALKKKYNVTALGAEDALKGASGLEGVEVKSFLSTESLSKNLRETLSVKSYDLIIHAAAVSDFIPVNKEGKKISSSEDLELNFEKAPKLLNELKTWSKNKEVKIVSFKLTHNQSDEEVSAKIQSQFENSDTDFVVHNELGQIDVNQHPYTIWSKTEKSFVSEGLSKDEMVKDLMNLGGV